MSTNYRQTRCNFEATLADLNLSPMERANALAVAHRAEQIVAAAQWISGTFKRLAGATNLKLTRA
jgi:hypothetical protein